jgi:hypothetical protein
MAAATASGPSPCAPSSIAEAKEARLSRTNSTGIAPVTSHHRKASIQVAAKSVLQ